MKAYVSALVLVGLAVLPRAAAAKVAQVSEAGFVVRHVAQLSASPDEAWAVLVKPSVWWESDHTWSGDAANLSLDARAGGCFCEILSSAASPKATPRGSVEHMRVIYAEKPRALRMVGGLGPLQADAVTATLTVQMQSDGKGGTQVLVEYVVGGFARTPFEKLAPAVDGMLGEQVRRLSQKLGGAFAAAFPVPANEAEPEVTAPAKGEVEPVEPLANDGIVPLSDLPPHNDGKIRGR